VFSLKLWLSAECLQVKVRCVQVYDLPYQESPAASAAIFETMKQLDWKNLLNKVDAEFCSWRAHTAVLYGSQVHSPSLCLKPANQAL
jgi:hypothetical protein